MQVTDQLALQQALGLVEGSDEAIVIAHLIHQSLALGELREALAIDRWDNPILPRPTIAALYTGGSRRCEQYSCAVDHSRGRILQPPGLRTTSAVCSGRCNGKRVTR
jgi:hypothetical protein